MVDWIWMACCLGSAGESILCVRGGNEALPELLVLHVGKTITDFQTLGCEFHQNAFGGRAPPGPAG